MLHKEWNDLLLRCHPCLWHRKTRGRVKAELQNRIGFLNQKVFINIGFKHRDNKILSTVVNPLNTNTFFINATFLPGPGLPTFSYNFQSINKNNEKTNLDSVGSKIVDLREDSDATTSVLALTYPFNSGNVKNNITGKKISSVEVLVRVASDNQNQN